MLTVLGVFGFTLCLLLAILGFSASSIFHSLARDLVSPFECGFDSKQLGREPFSVRFVNFILVFLVFDVETVFFLFLIFSYSLFSFWIFVVFSAVVFYGLLVEESEFIWF